MLDFGEDGSGLFMKYLRRGSGYYIDVGASELIADGKIKLKSGVAIERIKPALVVLDDGTELPADLIVYATGYGSMNGWVAQDDLARGCRQGRQVLGPRLGHAQGPGPVGGRAAQHVEADPAARPLVPRRQPAPVAALLAIPVAPAQSAPGGTRHARVQTCRGAPHRLSRRCRRAFGQCPRCSVPR